MPAADLHFSRRALASLQSFDNFLRPRNPATADALKAEIHHLCQLIREYPEMGRAIPGTRLRFHITRKYRYHLVYRVANNAIEIIDVLHPKSGR